MRKVIASAGVAILATALLSVPGTSSAAPGDTRLVPSSGTTSIRSLATGPDTLQQPEVRPGPIEADGNQVVVNRPRPDFKHGIFPKHPLDAPAVASSAVAATNPAVQVSIQGLNHRDQRLANGGNQFSVEPPDQALCVGNGFTVESVNSVLRVYNSSATPLTGVQDLNTFFGYPAAIDRTTGVIGASVIDPVCHYDPVFKRFVVAITTLDVTPAGDLTGRNTIDVAVSNTGNPTGAWTIYSVPAQNDGTEGTPNHGCTLDGTIPGPCFQDYPHIGGDANGIYITTNEYDLFGPNYHASQVFAFSKAMLAAHPASIPVTLVQNLRLAGTPGFTVWPATSPAGQFSGERNGTEYLLSSVAGDGSETGNPTGTARRIGLWALTNTASLNTASPSLGETSSVINSATYVFPPKADQKAGDFPLGQCINNTTATTSFGPGCWQLFFTPATEPAHNEVISHLDANDTRMQQTWFSNGILWGSLDTAVRVGGELRAGVAWFAVAPKINGAGTVVGHVQKQGYLALAGNNLTYPAIAMLPSGQGAIAFTVVGQSNYPSAGYAAISAKGTVGPIHIVAKGAGPADGFTSYKAFVGDPPRTRWGDYGAALTDGSSIWLASEYIAQTCTLGQYLKAPIGSCGNTRTSLGNWSTRMTKINP
jgi:hypothetical protein